MPSDAPHGDATVNEPPESVAVEATTTTEAQPAPTAAVPATRDDWKQLFHEHQQHIDWSELENDPEFAKRLDGRAARIADTLANKRLTKLQRDWEDQELDRRLQAMTDEEYGRYERNKRYAEKVEREVREKVRDEMAADVHREFQGALLDLLPEEDRKATRQRIANEEILDYRSLAQTAVTRLTAHEKEAIAKQAIEAYEKQLAEQRATAEAEARSEQRKATPRMTVPTATPVGARAGRLAQGEIQGLPLEEYLSRREELLNLIP